MCYLNNVVFACILMAVVPKQSSTQDEIGFPEDDDNPNIKSKEPIYLPAKCPQNQLYYPGDQRDDGYCDCRPGTIYHPASDTCWPAFERGPCQDGEYLILPQKSVVPACVKNPCFTDSYVPWNGTCERLGSRKPCMYTFPIFSSLDVNGTTLVLGCVRL